MQYYNIPYKRANIIRNLPKHSFGSFLPEIGTILQEFGIKTELIINQTSLPKNKLFRTALEEYRQSGGIIISEEVNNQTNINGPAIVQVDRAKLNQNIVKKTPHYIVIFRNSENIEIHDPLENNPYFTQLDKIIPISLQADRQDNNGGWLICTAFIK